MLLISATIAAGITHGIVKDRTDIFNAEYVPILIKESCTKQEYDKKVKDCTLVIEESPNLDYYTSIHAGIAGVVFAPSETLISLAANGFGYTAIYLASMRIGRAVSKTLRNHATVSKHEKKQFEKKLDYIVNSDISESAVQPSAEATLYADTITRHHKNVKLYTRLIDAIHLAEAQSLFRQGAQKLVDEKGFATLTYASEKPENPQLYLIHRDMLYTLNPTKDVSSTAIVARAEKFIEGYPSLIKRFTPETQLIILKADAHCEFNSIPIKRHIAQTISQYYKKGDSYES